MASDSATKESVVDDDFLLWNHDARLQTFAKHSWPFTSDCTCTPENVSRDIASSLLVRYW